MESVKQGASSETSSEEINGGSEQVNSESNSDRTATNKRSYECTYCKRGFTNAQALGGHMNIHRKDRAKAKQSLHNPVIITTNNFNYYHKNGQEISNFMVPSLSPFYGQPVDHDIDHHHRGGGAYFQPSSGPSIPSTFPFGYQNYESAPNQTSSLAVSNEELIMGADLSLQIDSAQCLDCDDHEAVRRGLVNDEALDLELRLGYR